MTKCFDDHGARGVLFIQHAFFEQSLDAVVGKKRTDLVSGQQFHFAVLWSRHRRAHAIAIGIGGGDEIGVPCSASSIAIVSASAFSGFGDFTVGNRPSRQSCSGTTLEIETEPCQHRFDDYAAGSVNGE